MNNFDLLCSMGAETDVLVHWIKSRRPKGELKVPPDVYCALLSEDEVRLELQNEDHTILYYYNCKITIDETMELV